LGECTCHFKIPQSAFPDISGCHGQTKALARKHVLGKHQIGAGALSKDVPPPELGSRGLQIRFGTRSPFREG
jgi:hypothetical protein